MVDTLSCNSATSGSTLGGSPMLELYAARRGSRLAASGPSLRRAEERAGDHRALLVGRRARRHHRRSLGVGGVTLGAVPRHHARSAGPRSGTFQPWPGRRTWVMVDGAFLGGAYQLQVDWPMKMVACVMVLGWLALAEPAMAQRPWADGVSAENQAKALNLFRRATRCSKNRSTRWRWGAIREALDAWTTRPFATTRLGRAHSPRSAAGGLRAPRGGAALGGAAPLRPRRSSKRRCTRSCSFGQIAELEVELRGPGAEVLLDGERFHRAGAVSHRRLHPGPHQLAAAKRRASSLRHGRRLPGGRLHRETVTMRALRARPVKWVRRCPIWVPWWLVRRRSRRRPGGRALHGPTRRLSSAAST